MTARAFQILCSLLLALPGAAQQYPSQITNASGVQVALHSYYPFGQEATDPAQTGFTKKFTGHERDTNGTGTAGDLDYMHARYCSPTLGRFLSFDPIGGNPRAPQSWNRYAYALNSPMNFTDPEGLFAQLFLDLYFVVFDEITVTASSYSSLVGYFYRLAYYFSEGVRPSIYGELGRPTPPAAGVSRALLEGDELERVRFGMSHGAIDTGGVPEFLIFLPVGRISRIAGGARRGTLPRAISTIETRADIVLSGGRSGQNVKNLTGPANSVVRGGGERAFVTNGKGQVVLDITKDRVKPVTPGSGFGPKRAPTEDELGLLHSVLRGEL